MITKKISDHVVKMTPTCGEVRGILNRNDYEGVNIAIAIDIRKTIPHFHRGFDEIYFILDGELELKFHDPETGKTWIESLKANELCVIRKGVHHAVVNASERNRLSVVTVPYFDVSDETPSEVI